MRVQVNIDSASTEQLRQLLRALAKIGKPGTATVGLNGPECWTASTPHLTEDEFEALTRIERWAGVAS